MAINMELTASFSNDTKHDQSLEFVELCDLQLALAGGGSSDVVFL